MWAIRPLGVDTDYGIWREASSSTMHPFKYICKYKTHTWNFRQWTFLWPIYMIRWFTVGLAIGLTVPSMKPKHWDKGDPFALIAAAKVCGSSQTRSKLFSKWLNLSYMSSMIYKKKVFGSYICICMHLFCILKNLTVSKMKLNSDCERPKSWARSQSLLGYDNLLRRIIRASIPVVMVPSGMARAAEKRSMSPLANLKYKYTVCVIHSFCYT